MTFKCIVCQRVQLVAAGRALPSGSWICTDLDDCTAVPLEGVVVGKRRKAVASGDGAA